MITKVCVTMDKNIKIFDIQYLEIIDDNDTN